MLGLTDVFFGLVTKLRVAELKTSSRFRKLLIWTVLLCMQALLRLAFNMILTLNSERTKGFSSIHDIRRLRNHLRDPAESVPHGVSGFYFAFFDHVDDHAAVGVCASGTSTHPMRRLLSKNREPSGEISNHTPSSNFCADR